MPDLPEPPADIAFGGDTYDLERDYDRLAKQLKAVFTLMSDGQWRTLSEISHATGASEAAASARLRDFRKDKYGARTVLRERVSGGGLFRYRLVMSSHEAEQSEEEQPQRSTRFTTSHLESISFKLQAQQQREKENEDHHGIGTIAGGQGSEGPDRGASGSGQDHAAAYP